MPIHGLSVSTRSGQQFHLSCNHGQAKCDVDFIKLSMAYSGRVLVNGVSFKLCSDKELLDVTMEHAQVLAAKPISSLIASKKLIMDPIRERIQTARKDEDNAFAELLGKPANLEALQAFAEKRDPDFF